MSRHNDPVLNVMDEVLQIFVGDRETRPDPGTADKPQVFRDFDQMTQIEPLMSNCGHTIDDCMDEQLRANPGVAYSQHCAWNFHGTVWFENEAFHEEVWVYGSPRQTISAASLQELMTKVNDEYGYD